MGRREKDLGCGTGALERIRKEELWRVGQYEQSTRMWKCNTQRNDLCDTGQGNIWWVTKLKRSFEVRARRRQPSPWRVQNFFRREWGPSESLGRGVKWSWLLFRISVSGREETLGTWNYLKWMGKQEKQDKMKWRSPVRMCTSVLWKNLPQSNSLYGYILIILGSVGQDSRPR